MAGSCGFAERCTYYALQTSATSYMYAYVNGKRAVYVGVYFCYQLSDGIAGVFGQIFQSVVEQFLDALRADRLTVGLCAPNDVL